MLDLAQQLDAIMPTALTGSVAQTVGMTAAVADFPAPVGALVEIERQTGEPLHGEVVGFRDALTIVSPFEGFAGVRRGGRVRLLRTTRTVKLGEELLGRVVNAHGEAIDGRARPALPHRAPLDRSPPAATQRPRIDTVLSTGVRAIDGLLTCGKGQRMGIFAGSGVGKSVTLGMMARYTEADVNVIALIGERGREVNEFIHRDLGPEGLARSVVVVATSDEPALLRVNAAYVATTVAEYFRDQGKDVLLLLDSATRFAMAQREIGLAAGEPPTTKGYPPGVFAELPRLLERAGPGTLDHPGSITGLFTVLVEGDDTNEPITDTVRGILDGHVILDRRIAERGRYPAVDVLRSLSRTAPGCYTPEQRVLVQRARRLMAAHAEMAELIQLGAYRHGSDPRIDEAIRRMPAIEGLLTQLLEEEGPRADPFSRLAEALESDTEPGPGLIEA